MSDKRLRVVAGLLVLAALAVSVGVLFAFDVFSSKPRPLIVLVSGLDPACLGGADASSQLAGLRDALTFKVGSDSAILDLSIDSKAPLADSAASLGARIKAERPSTDSPSWTY